MKLSGIQFFDLNPFWQQNELTTEGEAPKGAN